MASASAIFYFDANRFRTQVNAALEQARSLLEVRPTCIPRSQDSRTTFDLPKLFITHTRTNSSSPKASATLLYLVYRCVSRSWV